MLKVLDLFAGLKGWSEPFEERGHEVFTIELHHKFPGISLYKDIRAVSPRDVPWWPDVILASPPCTGFSVMQIGRNWTHEHEPKTDAARLALELVRVTIDLIERMRPKYFIIENPRAKLRRIPMMEGFERRTVTYCQYGERRMKPTDLWGGFPPSLKLHEICSNGDECHIRAPRGSTTGTQGMDPAQSAKIPYALARQICLAVERDI